MTNNVINKWIMSTKLRGDSMLGKSFKSIGFLERSLDASWLRNEVISNNIANVNTPNYKRQDVKFEALLNENISALSIELKLTHNKHMGFDSGNGQPVVFQDQRGPVRKDGNNVNIDTEMAESAKNTLYYNTLAQRVTGKFNKLRIVARDGR